MILSTFFSENENFGKLPPWTWQLPKDFCDDLIVILMDLFKNTLYNEIYWHLGELPLQLHILYKTWFLVFNILQSKQHTVNKSDSSYENPADFLKSDVKGIDFFIKENEDLTLCPTSPSSPKQSLLNLLT